MDSYVYINDEFITFYLLNQLTLFNVNELFKKNFVIFNFLGKLPRRNPLYRLFPFFLTSFTTLTSVLTWFFARWATWLFFIGRPKLSSYQKKFLHSLLQKFHCKIYISQLVESHQILQSHPNLLRQKAGAIYTILYHKKYNNFS